MALLGRDTVEHAVDHRGGLSTGDVALGAERAVGIARDPAVARGEPDVRLRPVARDVREAALALVELGEQRDDLCHLRARDGRVGAERAVGIAVHDAGLRHGGNRGVIPRVRRHVGISVGLGQVRAAALLRQQAEEDGRRLGAGDLAVRLHRAVRITDDVGEVVVRVQAESILIGNLHLGLLRLGGMAGRVVLGKGSVDRVVGHHLFKRVRAHRADALAVHQHVLDVIAGIWSDGKGLAFALGHGDCALGVDRTVLASRCGDNANFIDLDLQQMRSVRRIGVPNTDTVICTEIEWRIGLFAIHNMITEHHYKIVVIIALIGAAFISRVFRLCNGNGIMLAVHILNFHIARCGRKALLFFRASRAVQSVLSVPERYFVKPVVLKVNIILVSALILLQQWMIDLNTDRMLLAVADGHGEGLVSIDNFGFSVYQIGDRGVRKLVFTTDSCTIRRIILSFKLFIFI